MARTKSANSQPLGQDNNIVKTEFSEEMKQSFLDYSMSVLVARAVPDIRDGLKPVHRRILYTMHELNLSHDKPHKKSANVVGTTLAHWHPHGDASVYEAMVNLTHTFSLNTPLVDGHGNFGSIEGDAYASSRYTEARLQEYAEDVFLKDLNRDVVDYIENYDNSKLEPTILPAKVPNVLINGTNGIAVGTTTSTPPHNLTEVLEAYKAFMKAKNPSIDTLMETLKGPDFPTGGIIVNKSDLPEIYRTGQGKITIRGNIRFEEAQGRGDHDKLIITEIPYTITGLGIERFLSDVAELAKSKVLPEVHDILNQTTAEGVRLVIELKPNSDAERVKNILLNKTRLQDTFPVNMFYVINGVPKIANLCEVFEHFHEANKTAHIRKYKAILKKQKEIIEIKSGLIIAIDMIDTIIEVLRGSKNIAMAKKALMGISTEGIVFKTKTAEKNAKKMSFTELQAQAILEMKLSRLINLELNALIKEKANAEKMEKKCEKVLSSAQYLNQIIAEETDEIIAKYGRKRRTKIMDAKTPTVVLNTIKESDIFIAYDKFGYIRYYDTATYERNKDNIMQTNIDVLPTKSTKSIFIFTNTGNVHQIKNADIPMCKAKDRGTPADNISNYNSNSEHIIAIFSEEQLMANKLFFVTKNNTIKQVCGSEFVTSRKTITSTKLATNDEIVALGIGELSYVIVQSSAQFFLKLKVEDIPEQKRNSGGVRCMNIKEGDYLQTAYFVKKGDKNIVINGSNEILVSRFKAGNRATCGHTIK